MMTKEGNMREVMTRTQKTEKARKQVEEFLNFHLPELKWKITRSRDHIFPESHGGRHTMGLYSAFCILQDMESGKLLQDAQDHRDRYASDILIPFILQETRRLAINCSKCGSLEEAHRDPDAISFLRQDRWAEELWNKGWRIQDQACFCKKCIGK
jgi:hypothetical protein